jgi:hypothetical protein
VDAHILTTPAIADIDGDGADELVAAVSYFFDRQYYEKEVGTPRWQPAQVAPSFRLCALSRPLWLP